MRGAYLIHHGVKGQKWGVRRYQNPDGSLIHPKRKKAPEKHETAFRNPDRQEQMRAAQMKMEYNRAMESNYRKYANQYASVMSKKEIDDLVAHMKSEQELHKLLNPPKPDSQFKKVAIQVITNVATQVVKDGLSKGGKAIVDGMLQKSKELKDKDKDDDDDDD